YRAPRHGIGAGDALRGRFPTSRPDQVRRDPRSSTRSRNDADRRKPAGGRAATGICSTPSLPGARRRWSSSPRVRSVMADSVKLVVTGTPEQVGPVLEQALQPEGFRFTWANPADCIIEKGSRTKALLLGAFGTHYKYRVLLRPQPDGNLVVDLGLATTGMSGGAVGVAKVRRKLDEVGRVLTTAFQTNGTLVHA